MHYCYKNVETSYIVTQSYIKIMYIILTTMHTTYIYDFQNPPSNAFREVTVRARRQPQFNPRRRS